MRRNKYDYIGLSLVFSIFALTVIFLITCIKKKNLLAALAAVAALDVGAIWLIKHRKKKNGGYFFDFFDENSYEVFDESERESAGRAVRANLNKCREVTSRCNTVPLHYEIPVDNETTEEDFING